MTPSPRLLLLAALMTALPLAPMAVSPGLWPVPVMGWVALALVLLIEAVPLLLARSRIETTLRDRLGVGDTVPVALTIRSRSSWPLRGRLRGEWTGPVETVDPEPRLTLQPGSNATTVEAVGSRRGPGELTAWWLELEGVFGLLRLAQRHPVAHPLTIVPSVDRIRRHLIEFFGDRKDVMGGIQSRLRGSGGELDALESYVSGMDPRTIDWKASARHQHLTVRRFRLERNQRIVVSLDVGRLMADPIDGLQRLDHGIHAALTLAFAALKAGDFVGLHAYAEEPMTFLPPGNEKRQLERMKDACAALESREVETNHFLGLRDLLMRLKRRSLVIVFSEITDGTMAELMIENLTHLARRHLVILVALDDPVTEAPLAVAPDRPESLAEAVVAAELHEDRQRVLRRLEHAGVNVVHGLPGQATLELLARYVKIKRRGLIG